MNGEQKDYVNEKRGQEAREAAERSEPEASKQQAIYWCSHPALQNPRMKPDWC